MVFPGKVVGGDYMNSSVNTNQKGELVVVRAETVGLIFPKDRRINVDEVVEWEEVVADPRSETGFVGTVSRAVVGAALPGFVGKVASAAVGAGFDAAKRARLARLDWNDGKRSLVKLPPNLFTHLEMLLEYRRVRPTIPAVPSVPAAIVLEPEAPLDPTGQVLTQVAGLIRDHRAASEPDVDVFDQIEELAALRDRGILSEDEFVSKKSELLGRI